MGVSSTVTIYTKFPRKN